MFLFRLVNSLAASPFAPFRLSNMRHAGRCPLAILAAQYGLTSAIASSSLAFVPQTHYEAVARQPSFRASRQNRLLTARSTKEPGTALNMAAPPSLSFGPGRSTKLETSSTIVIGKKSFLEQVGKDCSALSDAVGFDVDPTVISASLEAIDGSTGSLSSVISAPEKPHRLSLCVLPEETTRNNHPMSVHTISELVAKECPGKGDVHIVIGGVADDMPVGPLALAVARAFPLYSKKTKDGKPVVEGDEREVCVSFLDNDGADAATDDESLHSCQVAAEAVRLAGRLVDAPPEELTTARFAEYCQRAANVLGTNTSSVSITEIIGDELQEKGYGGLYGVGKAAELYKSHLDWSL